jgi:hypothetical protein
VKVVLNKSNLGIVLNGQSSPGNDQSPLLAHLILNGFVVDDDGNICLSEPVSFQSILDLVETLKAELDGLADETLFYLAQNIALHRARASVASNDN